MDVDRSPNKHNNTSISTTVVESLERSQTPDIHNVAIDESNFSFENSAEFLLSQSMIELNDNNNNKDDNEDDQKDHPLSISHNQTVRKTTTPPHTTPLLSGKMGGGGGQGSISMSKLQMVCREMSMTEKTYVSDLQDIIEVKNSKSLVILGKLLIY